MLCTNKLSLYPRRLWIQEPTSGFSEVLGEPQNLNLPQLKYAVKHLPCFESLTKKTTVLATMHMPSPKITGRNRGETWNKFRNQGAKFKTNPKVVKLKIHLGKCKEEQKDASRHYTLCLFYLVLIHTDGKLSFFNY